MVIWHAKSMYWYVKFARHLEHQICTLRISCVKNYKCLLWLYCSLYLQRQVCSFGQFFEAVFPRKHFPKNKICVITCQITKYQARFSHNKWVFHKWCTSVQRMSIGEYFLPKSHLISSWVCDLTSIWKLNQI